MAKPLKIEQRQFDVDLFLAQEFGTLPESVVRQRLKEALVAGQDAHIVVLSEVPHEIAVSASVLLKEHAAAHNQFIVLPRGTGKYNGRVANRVAIYVPDGSEVLQEKISLSAGDIATPPVPDAGDTVLVHSAGHLRFAVLNCHDYTHAGIIRRFVDEELDVIVVVSANVATEMFAEYAKADVHRLFCYVVICNVAEYGGSGVFAPFHRRKSEPYATGEPDGALSMGGVQYQSRGRARAQATVQLAIPELRALRERYRRIDPDNPKEVRSLPTIYEAIAPPENVTYSRPHYRTVLDSDGGGVRDRVIDIVPPLETQGADNRWSVGVAQLHAASLGCYLRTGYMPSDDAGEAAKVCARVEQVLSTSADCDLLVFPEVFLPLRAPASVGTLHERVQAFATDTRTIVVTGVEYDVRAGEADAANRVRVYVPGQSHVDYTKVTRSQYDARDIDGISGDPLHIRRGDHLLRFDVGGRLSFGVLTCFDYSHLELVDAINLAGRDRPLDLLVVPCYNPYGALYADLARADAHRYYQYVVVCNVALHGDSGIFGPLKTKSRRRTLIHAGAGVDTVLRTTLDIGRLRKHRDVMTDPEIAKERKSRDPDRPPPFHRKPGLFTR